MAKYLVETYYTCTFKVNHYLDKINEAELKNLEKRDDGKFEVLDVKLDNRKTKNLEKIDNNKVNIIDKSINTSIQQNIPKIDNKLGDLITREYKPEYFKNNNNVTLQHDQDQTQEQTTTG